STSRSRSMISRIPGRNILTTTSSPVSSVAAWTWAMDAAASGARSKRQKIAPGRQRLAELDEDRSEFLERQAQPLAAGDPDAGLEPGPRRQIEEKTARPITRRGAP